MIAVIIMIITGIIIAITRENKYNHIRKDYYHKDDDGGKIIFIPVFFVMFSSIKLIICKIIKLISLFN